MNKPGRLDLETADITNENIAKIGAYFPNCLTEAKDEKGRTFAAIDFDKLRQELSHDIVEGADERYRFDWPEKRKATILANTPTRMTLRPCREESVDFDTTQNLYIEGDNLEVLKLLRETYFGKVKMIYIDPPYNTGKDSFVYDDDFRKGMDEFADESCETDEEGNIQFDLRENNESNGRFHTDWLNMIYPRLKLSKDLLTNEGVVFISIDDNEIMNLRKVCDEIFGERNFIAQLVIIVKPEGRRYGAFAKTHEFCLVYCKNIGSAVFNEILDDDGEFQYADALGGFNLQGLRNRNVQAFNSSNRPNLRYPFYVDVNSPDKDGFFRVSAVKQDGWEQVDAQVINGIESVWRWGRDTAESKKEELVAQRGKDGVLRVFQKMRSLSHAPKSVWNDKEVISNKGSHELQILLGKGVFDFPKPVEFCKRIISIGSDQESIVLDFFSGSATTAHAVMKLNAEDGGKRKFIMVQLPEPCDEKSEAAKAGYKNICEIGKERIRRAGKKILEEVAAKNAKAAKESAQGELALGGGHAGRVTLPDGGGLGEAALPDVGFRVLKLDTSNMEEVYYSPKVFADKVMQGTLNLDGDASLAENIKQGRTGEDLLFQSMLRLDVPLSAKIETEEIHGKRVFVVDDGYMMATFDKDVNEEAIKAIAKRTPSIFVMCDGGFATDNVADNFEQIWKAFSPDTVRRVI